MLTLLRRKSVTEQAQEKVTPDSQKSTMDKASENVTGVGDKIAGSAQPRKISDLLSVIFHHVDFPYRGPKVIHPASSR